MFAKVPKDEFLISLFVYAGLLIYGVIHVYDAREAIEYVAHFQLIEGWSFIGHKMDASSYSWHMISIFYEDYYWILLLHIILCEICRATKPEFVTYLQIAISIGFMLYAYRIKTCIIVLGQIIPFFFIATIVNSSAWLWFIGFLWLIVLTLFRFTFFIANYDFIEYHDLLSIVAWNILKFMSFMLDRKNVRDPLEQLKFNFVNYCGYMLYFPTMVHGPILVYDRYKCCMDNDGKPKKPLPERILCLVIGIGKLVALFFMVRFTLHFIYVFQLQVNSDAVNNLNIGGLYGFGFLTILYLYFYCILCYGVGRAVSLFDGMDTPPQSKCIATLNTCTSVCKNVDPGLFEFSYNYIYSALCREESNIFRKIFATFVMCLLTFTFSGVHLYLIFWALLIFSCVMLEKLVKIAFTSNYFSSTIGECLSKNNQGRLHRFAIGQIYIPFAISLIFLLSDTDIGMRFIHATYAENPLHYLTLTVWTYAMAHLSDFISERKDKNSNRKFTRQMSKDFV